MGVVSPSVLFHSRETEPLSTVLINDGGALVERKTMTADTANLKPGMLTYITASTYPNEITESGAEHGKLTTSGGIWVVDIEASTANLAQNWTKDTAYADLDSVQAFHLRSGMQIWLRGSSLTAALEEILVPAASGLITNVDDTSPDDLVYNAHSFKALTALTSGTWIPCEYVGLSAIDST